MIGPALRRLCHAAEAIAVFAAWGLFSLLPIRVASALAESVARTVGPRLRKSQVARQNLRLVFSEMDEDRIDDMVVAVWENLERTVGEFPHLHAAERLEIVGGEHAAALGDDGLPGVLIGAHFGGRELSGALAERLGMPVHVVYRAANNPWIKRLFRRARGVSAGGFIPKGAQGARKAVAVLRAGGHLGMLVDQKMNDGIAVPFMGRDAMTAPAVAHLALKFRYPVIPGRIERPPGARFRAIIEPPIALPDTGDRHRDVRELMASINAVVERWVRERPDQWLWLHRRWPKQVPL